MSRAECRCPPAAAGVATGVAVSPTHTGHCFAYRDAHPPGTRLHRDRQRLAFLGSRSASTVIIASIILSFPYKHISGIPKGKVGYRGTMLNVLIACCSWRPPLVLLDARSPNEACARSCLRTDHRGPSELTRDHCAGRPAALPQTTPPSRISLI